MIDRRGTTFLEILIYTGIVALVSILVINSILIINSSFNSYRLTKYVNLSAATAMERMTREARLADTISEASVFDSHPGCLVFDSTEFFALSSQLMIKVGSDDSVALTPQGVEVSNLIFREVATSTNLHSKAIRIEMELSASRGKYEKSVKFYNTIVLRGSY